MNRVEIFRGWCKKCGICIAFCPHQVLAADDSGYPVVKSPEECTGCLLCEMRCPDFAIVVYQGEESRQEADSPAGK
jgi:2-oxoglutarate ferredoxin oxidoreductase subunit delta